VHPERHSKEIAGSGKKKVTQTYFRSAKPKIPKELSRLVENVQLPEPAELFATILNPPVPSYDHLQIPDDIARNMDATKVHVRGITGKGIRIVMIDTGFMTPLHSFYLGKGYKIKPVVADADDPRPKFDDIGHGTAVAACALTIAPGATFIPVKFYGDDMVNAFHSAIKLDPHIITCSWGYPEFPSSGSALKLAIDYAVSRGIVVIFACGNKRPDGVVLWPASERSVIAVGGACLLPDDSVIASSFAVSGRHPRNPGRKVPDVCGLCGMDPLGVYIVLPTQPGSAIDKTLSVDGRDRTNGNDGWVVASGTSSCAPMVAGVVALLMQANPALVGKPELVRKALIDSCKDITSGITATGDKAGPGEDIATGAGLVQAYCAVNPVDVWIKHNPDSDMGLVPTHGRRPSYPPYNHWSSPDIKVFSAPLADPDKDFERTPETQPAFGQENYVYVRLRNRGRGASGRVSVSFYFSNPSTRLSFPADWNDGNNAHGSIRVGNIVKNVQIFSSVDAHGEGVLPEPFVWVLPNPTPVTETQTLANGLNVGHFSLLVTLTAKHDPLINIHKEKMSPLWDNNIGMKNWHVYSAHSFSESKSIGFFIAGDSQKSTSKLLFEINKLPKNSVIFFEKENGRFSRGSLDLINAKFNDGRIKLSIRKKQPSSISGIVLGPREKMPVRMSIELPSRTRKRDYPINVLQVLNGKLAGGITLVAKITKKSG
jgi:serine protease AprX